MARIIGGIVWFLLAAWCLSPRLFASTPALPVSGRNEPALVGIDDVMSSFLVANKVPGAAVAIARQGRLVYARGFGWADVAEQRSMQPDSLFRIASLSKSITAAAILKLAESRAIGLQDHAFPYLGIAPFLRPGQTVDPRLERITIWHLLHHSGGFDREQSFDPALCTLEIAHAWGRPFPWIRPGSSST